MRFFFWYQLTVLHEELFLFVLCRTGKEKGNGKTLAIAFEKEKKKTNNKHTAFAARVLYVT